MAAETMHPYQRNDYQGTEVIQARMAEINVSVKGFPLMTDEQLTTFHALRAALKNAKVPHANDVLKLTMAHFKKTGGDFLVIFDPAKVGI